MFFIEQKQSFFLESLIQITHKNMLKQPTPRTVPRCAAELLSIRTGRPDSLLQSICMYWSHWLLAILILDDSKQPQNIIVKTISLCQLLLYFSWSCEEGVGGGGRKRPWLTLLGSIYFTGNPKKSWLCLSHTRLSKSEFVCALSIFWLKDMHEKCHKEHINFVQTVIKTWN